MQLSVICPCGKNRTIGVIIPREIWHSTAKEFVELANFLISGHSPHGVIEIIMVCPLCGAKAGFHVHGPQFIHQYQEVIEDFIYEHITCDICDKFLVDNDIK